MIQAIIHSGGIRAKLETLAIQANKSCRELTIIYNFIIKNYKLIY